ncbi:hypothetical protein A2J03_07120 [Rhodococcus sp. EPR-157]|uniref:DUF5336 domain-containing protein n=1 Tax=Rhodococcus sp. EPR-157 TaxID=1813677 RepID=UPI0007BBC992|nr:DUF5336 domain-containing protein [Rhodococcus sp. EPR-157]KZF03743.1 hypothetical protein A2J03_07120 [Rhodococcus sp. EPR-157]
MTFSPEGPRSSGPGSGGYGSGYSPEGARPSTPGYGGYSQAGQAGQQYGAQQPSQQQPSQFGQSPSSSPTGQYTPPRASDRPSPLPRILALVVAGLGVVSFLVGLAGQYEVPGEAVNFFFVQTGDPTSIALLLAGGLVAASGLLPKQAGTMGVAAALSITGWLVLVFQAFNTGDAGPIGASIELGVGGIIVLVLGFVQSVLAVAATLFGAGVIKAPQPKPKSYGQTNFQGYGQQAPGYGQQGQGYGGYAQPTQQNYGVPGQGYVPPNYTGPSQSQQGQQNQPNQNTTGGLGYPVGTSKPESGLTGPAGQNSPFGQPQYGQPPAGSEGYGAPQHAVPSDAPSERTDESGDDSTPPYSAPTQAFGQTSPDEDKK